MTLPPHLPGYLSSWLPVFMATYFCLPVHLAAYFICDPFMPLMWGMPHAHACPPVVHFWPPTAYLPTPCGLHVTPHDPLLPLPHPAARPPTHGPFSSPQAPTAFAHHTDSPLMYAHSHQHAPTHTHTYSCTKAFPRPLTMVQTCLVIY